MRVSRATDCAAFLCTGARATSAGPKLTLLTAPSPCDQHAAAALPIEPAPLIASTAAPPSTWKPSIWTLSLMAQA